MTRFVNGLCALGVALVSVVSPVWAQDTAQCAFYEGREQSLGVEAKPGQYVYVQWAELNGPNDGVNFGEPMMSTRDGYAEPQYVAPGWYIFRNTDQSMVRIDYRNRDFMPEKFEVKICLTDKPIDPRGIPGKF